MKELMECQLRRCCQLQDFHFKSTKDLSPTLNIIGQDRAIRAIETGLHTKSNEFNIFISGLTGTGRSSTIRILLDQLAPKQVDPPDWAFVYNFKERNFPRAIAFQTGKGREFSDDFDEFISLIREKITEAFKSDHYEGERNRIVSNAQLKIKDVYQEMNKMASDKGFVINTNPEGIFTVPKKDDKPMTQEEFNALKPEEQDTLEKARIELQTFINSQLKKVQQFEKLREKNLLHWINELAGLHYKFQSTI